MFKGLNERRKEILRLFSLGFTAKEIGAKMGFDYRNIETQLTALRKFNKAKNGRHLIYLARKGKVI